MTKVPGLDTPAAFAKRTGSVPITDVARSFDAAAPILVINARTLRRQLIWTELDSNASTPANTALLIHPARNFREGERYIVALRNLRGADGALLQPSAAFRKARDRIETNSLRFERRRPHMEHVFKRLKRAGVKRGELYLAWDFTVASAHSLSSRLRHIRDDAFRGSATPTWATCVSGSAPKFRSPRSPTSPPAQNAVIRRRVEGTVEVPCCLDQPGCPAGSRFRLGPNGQPVRTPGNVTDANFICNIPRSVSAATPGRLSLYGHGLFGSAAEVNSISQLQIASEHKVVLCASDWIGMSGGDIPNTLSILQDLSGFPELADRLQQGFLNFLFLGRAMIHPKGFARASPSGTRAAR